MKALVFRLGLSAFLLVGACSSSAPGTGPQDAAGGAQGDAGTGGSAAGSGGSTGTGGGGGGGATGTGGAAGSGGAQTGGADGGLPNGNGDGSSSDGSPGDGAVASVWPAVTDFSARGPFPIVRENDVGPNAGYDIFRPAQLGAEQRKHPIVSWNNGTLYAIDRYQALLEHWASHGFFVMGGHTNTTAGGAVHKAAIDWMVAENARTDSAYFGKLDVKKIGASGHSQGGGATITAGSNIPGPAGIVTSMPLMPIASFQNAQLAQHAASMLIISATEDTRANGVANQAFAAVTTEFVDAQFVGVHEDAMNPGIHGATVAWFRYQLMGDLTAKAQFYPPATCGLCNSAAWMRVRYKNSP